MLMIRFQRIGRINDPAFRIVLTEKARAAKTGGITEQLGTYNPKSKALTLDEARVKEWIAKGAQPTDSIRNLLISKGIIEGKKVNVLPKKTPIKKEQEAVAAPVPTLVEEEVAETTPPE
jgi:small subunit ribosomal protein S16